MTRWFDLNLHQRRVVVRGPLRRRGPFLLHDFAIETDAGTLHLSFDDLTLPKALKPLVAFLARRIKPQPPQ